MHEDTYQINDLEQLTGIKAHTIRIWEKRYGLLYPQRTESNIRYYTSNDLKKLLNISILNKNGIKISRIAELSDAEINARVIEFSSQSGEVEDSVQNLVMAMFHFDTAKFEKLLTVLYINRGFEGTFIDIIWPFMSKVGLLWQTGTITVAHEHFVSNLIRRKLLVAIDSCLPLITTQSKKCVLFLPENETHELGLLLGYYILKRNHHIVTYLGASLPLSSIANVNFIHQADAIITSLTSIFTNDSTIKYIESLSAMFLKQRIIIIGSFSSLNNTPLPANVILLKGITELTSVV